MTQTLNEYLEKIKEELSQPGNKLIYHIKKLTEALYKNPKLLFGSFNEEFERSGIVKDLLECVVLENNQQTQRDILRLLNIFIRTNEAVKNQARSYNRFLEYLSNILDKDEVWRKLDDYKHHICAASILLMTENKSVKFKVDNIRERIRSKLFQQSYNFEDEDIVRIVKVYLIMYSNSCFRENFDDIPINGSEERCDEILNKILLGRFNDTIRDYIDSFMNCYNSKSMYLKTIEFYDLKKEFTYNQICYTICYFSKQCKNLRINLMESGFYDILTKIFLLDNIPISFILISLCAVEIAAMDEGVIVAFKEQKTWLIDRLKRLKTNYKNSEAIQNKLCQIFNKFQIDVSSTDNSQPTSVEQYPIITGVSYNDGKKAMLSIKDWGRLDVDNWMVENNLGDIRNQFDPLTGKGLRVFSRILQESNGRSKLLELLMNHLKIDLIRSLEFIGALEDLI